MASVLFRHGTTDEAKEKEAEAAAGRDETTGDRPARRPIGPSRAVGEGPAGPSVIGPGTEITGQVTMRGDLRVEGRIEGDVSTRGEVVVSDRGSVKGEVDADVVVIEGRVDGQVRAREVARLKRGCRVTADIASPAVELDEGSVFNGRIDMSDGAGAASSSSKGRGDAPGGSSDGSSRGGPSGGSGGGKASEASGGEGQTKGSGPAS